MEYLQASEWAHDVFSGAQLGDPRRVQRLIKMAAAAASQPGGTVTATMGTVADKEGAFRFLESARFEADAISTAMFDAMALNCGSPTTFVVLDQTDLSFVDRKNVRGLGPVCYRNSNNRKALHVMNALALDVDGSPTGLVGQQVWLRPEMQSPGRRRPGKGLRNDQRPVEEREAWQWVRTLIAARSRLNVLAPRTLCWFVADRAADCHGFLCNLCEAENLFTVRSSYDRVIKHKGARRTLWNTLRRQKVMGHVEVTAPTKTGRRRRVQLEVRALTAEVRIRRKEVGREAWETLSCVRVREVGTPPRNENRIEWKLLTNHPVEGFEQALAVLRSYTFRWRVEDFHKTWKSGACNVESSQLRSYEAIKRWATILAAVASRIERLKHLSRTEPETDALREFSREELDAAIILTETKSFSIGSTMNLQQAVRLVAMVGGHMGRKGDGPPGTITIRRGLERILPAAQVLQVQRTSG